MSDETPERVATAWHEAGHVIAYVAHGRRIRYVTVRPRTPDVVGMTKVRPRRIDHFARAVIAYAGPIAEGMHAAAHDDEGLDLEDYIVGALLSGGDGDWQAITECMAINGDGIEPFAQRSARSIVTREWASVEAVAAALIERGTLTYTEVLPLVSGDLARLRRGGAAR